MANALKRLFNSLMEVDNGEWEDERELDYPEESESESDYEDALDQESDRRQSFVSRRSSAQNVTNLPNAGRIGKMVIYCPVSYEDTQSIIDNLRSQTPVIVNLEQIEWDTAQRVLDFLSGAAYALNGCVQKISSRIFVVAPSSTKMIGGAEASRR